VYKQRDETSLGPDSLSCRLQGGGDPAFLRLGSRVSSFRIRESGPLVCASSRRLYKNAGRVKEEEAKHLSPWLHTLSPLEEATHLSSLPGTPPLTGNQGESGMEEGDKGGGGGGRLLYPRALRQLNVNLIPKLFQGDLTPEPSFLNPTECDVQVTLVETHPTVF